MAPRKQKKIRNPDGTYSKRPVKAPTVKRKNIEGEDGWTHVVGAHHQKISEITLHNVVYMERSLEEMLAQHEKILRRWQESETRQTLVTAVEEFGKRGEGMINKIVCLGLGTLQNGNLTQQNNRHAQLAALLDVADVLGGTSQLTMLAQDPAFGPCDKSFLESLGIQVAAGVEGVEAIDGQTFVHAIHCHEPLYEEVSKAGRPAILVGNDLEDLCSQGFVSGWLKSFTDDYQDTSIEPALPKRKERTDHFDQIFNAAFFSTRMYVRKPKLQEPLHSAAAFPIEESSLVSMRGGHHAVQETAADEYIEGEDDEESDEEEMVPIAQDLPKEDFDIFEDMENLSLRPARETVSVEEIAGDPAIENKENCPPDESNQTPETLQDGSLTRELGGENTTSPTRRGHAYKRSSLQNWIPGLHLNTLPAFNHGSQESFDFKFVFLSQAPTTSSSPVS